MERLLLNVYGISTKEICKRGFSMIISLSLENTRFPLAHRLPRNAEQIRKLLLRVVLFPAQRRELVAECHGRVLLHKSRFIRSYISCAPRTGRHAAGGNACRFAAVGGVDPRRSRVAAGACGTNPPVWVSFSITQNAEISRILRVRNVNLRLRAAFAASSALPACSCCRCWLC